MRKKLALVLYLWTVGIFGGVIFSILRLTRRVQVKGYKKEKFDSKGRGLVLISNHPSPAEPMFLPFLLFPRFLWSLRFTPYSLPEKKHYNRKEFIPLRKVCIPVDRKNGREGLKTFKEMEEMLNSGKILILHPEKEHTLEKRPEDYRFSKSEKTINKFRPGIRKLFSRTDCLVLPVWIDGGPGVIPNDRKYSLPTSFFQFPRLWRKVIIKIGDPIEPANFSNNGVVEYLENVLLELADKEI
jgi:1-acyl-sn-glycerol-3-phosphate acyltransferase